MSSVRTQTKTIRIGVETEEYFRGKPLNRYVESLHHLIESGRLTISGEEIIVPHAYALAGLGEMADLCGMSVDDMAEQLYDLMDTDQIVFENGRLAVNREEEDDRK